MELTSNSKGEIAELKVQLRAAEKGWVASRTVEGARYDLVLDDGKKLYRAQVKYAGAKGSHSEGSATVYLTRSEGDDRNKNGKYRRRKTRRYNSKEVDAILVYLPQIDKVCWLGPELFSEKPALALRYESPKNGQKKGIHLAEEYIW